MALDPSSAGLSDAVVVLGAAGLVIPAFARLRISPVIGFILVGIIVGPFGLGTLVDRMPWLFYVTISDPKAMAPFAEFGIILLLFSVGLELSFRRLWAMRRAVLGIGAAELVGNAALITAALIAFGYPLNASLGLGLALALSSTALVLPMSGTTSAVGKLAFAMLLFEDLALVPIIFGLGALGPGGRDLGAMGQVLGIGILVVVGLLLLGRLLLPRAFAQAARTHSPELFLSVTLLVVILASLATLVAGLSPIVGALIAGLVIAETDYVHEVEGVIAPFKNLALGVFLLTVGMQLDLGLLVAQWPALLGAVAIVVTLKAAFTSGLLWFGGARTGVAAETGILMASPSELTLVVLGTSLTAGLIDAQTATFWSGVTAIGLILTPLLAAIGHRVSVQIGREGSDAAPPPEGSVTVVIGYGRVGEMVADMLDVHNKPWIAIEADVDVVAAARRAGKSVRYGDAGRSGATEALHLDRAAAVVLTMNDPVQNVRLARRLRADHPELTIVARARDAGHAAELYRAGVTDAVPETLESSLQLSEAVLVDLGVAMGPVIASIHQKRDDLRAEIKDAGGLSEKPRLKAL
ncbi:cation:proton antiporter [Sphingomonas sp. SUN039]|uniref:cation:proton antiporter domain-containing protein n=1 Tax=Sphingomonas sp. SUN039 TaxID=2937787 RepID=UPI0021649798|nr:cation:proton antiporter [Sphingomonas sp. SUN039]UVO53268.1 cation:proton antiporter [Sphingomonas sp. SUN039]